MTPEEVREAENNDAVFKQIYIPRTLQELTMQDIDRMKGNKD